MEWSETRWSGTPWSGEWSREWGVERNHPEGVLISYMISCDFPFSCGGYDPSREFASDAKRKGRPPSKSGSHCNPDSLGRRSPDEGSIKSTATPWSSVARVGVCLVASITHMSCIPRRPRGTNMGPQHGRRSPDVGSFLLCQTHTRPLVR